MWGASLTADRGSKYLRATRDPREGLAGTRFIGSPPILATSCNALAVMTPLRVDRSCNRSKDIGRKLDG